MQVEPYIAPRSAPFKGLFVHWSDTSSCHAHRNSQGFLEEAAVYKIIKKNQPGPARNQPKKEMQIKSLATRTMTFHNTVQNPVVPTKKN